MPLRVLLAEDHLLVREGIIRLLQVEPDLEVVAVCQDLDDLLDAASSSAPDVVVTDIRMPPTMRDEGIRAAVQLRATRPELGVVVLTQYPNPDYLRAVLAEGSHGRAYLLKDRVSEGRQLADAVRAVARGGSVVDPVVVETLMASTNPTNRSDLGKLTPRERDVLAAMARGLSNAAIASALFITQRAVEKHVNAIFARLGLTEEQDVSRRVMAVLMYLTDQRRTR
jgi:DNA-binding NarL/FixJ family response regulator